MASWSTTNSGGTTSSWNDSILQQIHLTTCRRPSLVVSTTGLSATLTLRIGLSSPDSLRADCIRRIKGLSSFSNIVQVTCVGKNCSPQPCARLFAECLLFRGLRPFHRSAWNHHEARSRILAEYSRNPPEADQGVGHSGRTSHPQAGPERRDTAMASRGHPGAGWRPPKASAP